MTCKVMERLPIEILLQKLWRLAFYDCLQELHDTKLILTMSYERKVDNQKVDNEKSR